MKIKIIHLMLAAVAVTTGCQNRLVFVTQTSMGLDISGTANYPNKISLSHHRYEAAIVPRKTDGTGESHSVFGGMDSDLKFAIPPKLRIDQVFATGNAAIQAVEEKQTTAAATTAAKAAKTKPDSDKSKTSPLIFLTGTTFGLHFSSGEQELNPTALVGYRRSEATMIPIVDPDQEVQSVYADIHISSQEDEAKAETDSDEVRAVADSKKISQWGGMRVQQSFGTGKAAEILAGSNATARKRLNQAANLASTKEVEQLEKRGKQTGQSAATTIDGLPANKLEAAGQAALETKVLGGTIEEFKALDETGKRNALKAATDSPVGNRAENRVKAFHKRLKAL